MTAKFSFELPPDDFFKFATCKGLWRTNPHLHRAFFSHQDFDKEAAARICSQCPVSGPCYLYAKSQRTKAFGIWGGHFFFEGKITRILVPGGVREVSF